MNNILNKVIRFYTLSLRETNNFFNWVKGMVSVGGRSNILFWLMFIIGGCGVYFILLPLIGFEKNNGFSFGSMNGFLIGFTVSLFFGMFNFKNNFFNNFVTIFSSCILLVFFLFLEFYYWDLKHLLNDLTKSVIMIFSVYPMDRNGDRLNRKNLKRKNKYKRGE